ncbi:MAG: hypothetical protein FWF24_03360 [Alphaproteobacteria bacterium]|nr:hypothetical protein [Alphaproteobacteria bacterium]
MKKDPFNPDHARGLTAVPAHEKMRGRVTETRSFEAYLQPSETILWQGAPAPQALRLNRQSFVVYPFAFFWLAFSLFWVNGASTPLQEMAARGFQETDFVEIVFAFVFPLFGVPFVLAGLWLLYKPFADRNKIRRSIYALTNDRALILKRGWRNKLISIPFQESLRTAKEKAPQGDSGTLAFFNVTSSASMPRMMRDALPSGEFSSVARIDAVEDVFVQAFTRKTGHAPLH